MTTDTPARCGACGARLSPGADWCSLCLTPVAPTPAAVDPPAGQDPPAGPVRRTGAPPPEARQVPADAADAADDVAAEVAAERLLARLQAESVRQRPLGAGRLAGASRGALLGLGVLLALGASAVVVGLLWLVGLAL